MFINYMKNSHFLITCDVKPEIKGGWGTWRMRAHAPSIAQGEGRSLGNGEIGVFSLRPLTIHQERQKASYNIKLLPIKYVVQVFRDVHVQNL